MKHKKSHEKMWDLLIPLLCVISVIPFIIHLAVYDCGYSVYPWYVGDGILSDFFCCVKSYALELVGLAAAIILLFFLTIYKERAKNMRCFIPLGIYALFVILSTLFSRNFGASLKGNFESFEGCFVLLSYVILAVYAYQLTEYEKDYRILAGAVLFTSAICILLGMTQIFGHDYFDFPMVQRLIMGQASKLEGTVETVFSGNNVYLTLYNPNYAGIVLSMLFAVLFVLFLTEKETGKRILYAVFSLLMLIVTWFTYSRASVITLVVTVVLAFLYNRKKQGTGNLWKAGVLLLLAVILVVAADQIGGAKFLSRFLDKNDREPLTALTTNESGISLIYDEREYRIFLSEDEKELFFENMREQEALRASEGEELSLPIEDAKLFFVNQDVPRIYMYFAENTLSFTMQDGVYLYETPDGKAYPLEKVPTVDFHGYEYLGSARVYIWSRVLPMLGRYLLVGSGPDTFAEVYPQDDIAGKVVYADNASRVMEKAHNDILTKWVQTGFLSAGSVLAFYLILIIKGNAFFSGCVFSEAKERLGFGCYLACISYMLAGCFNDSTVQTAPLFWVFSGIALSSIYVKDAAAAKDRKKRKNL